MVAERVASREDVEHALEQNDFEPTGQRTATGEYWRHRRSGRHILVPDSYQGYYPDWMLGDLSKEVGKVVPGSGGDPRGLLN
jgi:hypothetical protein